MKILPIAFAVAVAGVTVWRWARLGWPLRATGAVVCVALVLYGTGVVHPPDLDEAAAKLGSTLGPYTYVLVAVMALLETGAFVGLLLPGETVVIVGGVVAGQGHIDVWVLLGLTWICALAGDLTGYMLGRRLGRQFLLAHGSRVQISKARLERIESFFARYGQATIVIGRFVGLVRPAAPFVAGASAYPPGRFAAFAILGTGLWSATCVSLGYVCWQSLDEAISIAKNGTLALGAAVALAVVAVAGYRYLRGRDRSGQRSLAEDAG